MKNEEGIIENKCDRCGTSLLDVLVIQEDPELNFPLVFHCDTCGHVSDPKSFNALIKFSATEECDIGEMVIDEDENVIHFYLKRK